MIDYLVRIGVEPTQARRFADPLMASMALFNITTPQREAAFIAQCMAESGRFTRLEENLFYTTPERIRAVFSSRVRTLADAATLTRNPKALANRVYAGRNGNGDEASGDGWRYRGRGLFQLTGRANYAKATQAIARDYVGAPDLVAEPSDACLTAAWYWNACGCNELIDAGRFDATTRAINGPAMLHARERLAFYQEAMEVFA